MKIYLAGWESEKYMLSLLERLPTKVCLLGSYPYISSRVDDYTFDRILDCTEDFILDSGAFTFMNNKSAFNTSLACDYIKKYADFIKRHNILNFIELDVDSIIGYKRVLELRHMLNDIVGMKCIPAWHLSRGIEDFSETSKDYSYVALGTSFNIPTNNPDMLSALCYIAQKNKCKIHILAFTSPNKIQKYHVESVDSSTWLASSNFGDYCIFNGNRIRRIRTQQRKVVTSRLKVHNFIEWYKYQRWALTHL